MTTRSFDHAQTGRRPVFLDHNLHIVFAVTWTAMMSVGSLTPIFPSVMEAYQISSQEVGLLITGFTLPGVFLAPVAGLLADRFGRKRVLVPSLLLFGTAGGSCAFASDFDMLLVLRVLQGCGGAALGSLNNTLIGDLYTGRDRVEAIGYNASAQNLTTLSTPLLAGAIALFGWNYPFLLPMIGFPVAYLVAFHLRNKEPAGERQSMGEYMGEAFRSIASRRMFALMLGNFVSVLIAFGVLMVYLALLMQERFEADPLTIGFIVASSSIVAALVSTRLGRVAQVMSRRSMIVWGMIVSAAGVVLNPFMPGLWLMLVPAVIKGVSQGILQPALFTLILEEAPVASRAGVLAFSGMISRVGQTLAPLVFGLCFALGGLGAVFDIGAVMLVASALAIGIMLGPDRIHAVEERAAARIPAD